MVCITGFYITAVNKVAPRGVVFTTGYPTWTGTSCTSFTLVSACFAYASHLQAAQSCEGVINHMLGTAAVRHKPDSVDGDGCLCNIGGQDTLSNALRRSVEGFVLLRNGKRCMEGYNNPPPRFGCVLNYHLSSFMHVMLNAKYIASTIANLPGN